MDTTRQFVSIEIPGNMPRGYASATADEVHAAKSAGRTVPRDTQRNRRLDDAELARIRAALAGTKAPGKQRALPSDAGFALLFELILGTGLRLSEAYSLRVDQVDLARWVLNVEGSKGHRGAARPRMVPLVRRLRVPLQAWCRDRVGRGPKARKRYASGKPTDAAGGRSA